MIKANKIINEKIYFIEGDLMKKYFLKFAYSLISTRFFVFVVSCFLLWYAKISDMVWLFTALGFIGVRTLNKFIENKGK
jgi:hypothetical protein